MASAIVRAIAKREERERSKASASGGFEDNGARRRPRAIEGHYGRVMRASILLSCGVAFFSQLQELDLPESSYTKRS
jgi:hypothetical protein